nr:DapH/DapD/GlmU-related protein [Adlercreutzia sp. ZJ473]
MRQQTLSIRPVAVGSDCWLGAGVTLLAGAAVQDGSVVGAGTVLEGIARENMIVFQQRVIDTVARR